MAVLRISAQTHPMQNAKAIAGLIHKHRHAEVQAIGRPAVHQAMKAMAQAIGHLKEEGIYVGFTVKYIAEDTDGNEKEGFRFFIDPIRSPMSSFWIDEDPDQAESLTAELPELES